MDYTLAKELKGAGFPLLLSNMGSSKAPGFECTQIQDLWYYTPTLEELIEACGDKFEVLQRHDKDIWSAAIYGNSPDIPAYEYEGKTPEEAVAKLWIALQNKK